jgi:hypothetical protein
MIGYVHNTSKIWRLWDPKFRRIICSSDVVFDESRIPGDPLHGPGSDTLKDCLPETDITYQDESDPATAPADDDQSKEAKPTMPRGGGKGKPFSSVAPPNAILGIGKGLANPSIPMDTDNLAMVSLDTGLQERGQNSELQVEVESGRAADDVGVAGMVKKDTGHVMVCVEKSLPPAEPCIVF